MCAQAQESEAQVQVLAFAGSSADLVPRHLVRQSHSNVIRDSPHLDYGGELAGRARFPGPPRRRTSRATRDFHLEQATAASSLPSSTPRTSSAYSASCAPTSVHYYEEGHYMCRYLFVWAYRDSNIFSSNVTNCEIPSTGLYRNIPRKFPEHLQEDSRNIPRLEY